MTDTVEPVITEPETVAPAVDEPIVSDEPEAAPAPVPQEISARELAIRAALAEFADAQRARKEKLDAITEDSTPEPNAAGHANHALVHALRFPLFHVRKVRDEVYEQDVYEVALNERHVSEKLSRLKLRNLPFDFARFDTAFTIAESLRAQLVGQAFITVEPLYISGLMLLLNTRAPTTVAEARGVEEPTDYYEVTCCSSFTYVQLWKALQTLRMQTLSELEEAEATAMLSDAALAELANRRAHMPTAADFPPLCESLADEESRFKHTVARINDLERQIMYLCRVAPKHHQRLMTQAIKPEKEHVHPLVKLHGQAMCHSVVDQTLRQRRDFIDALHRVDREEMAREAREAEAERRKNAPPEPTPSAAVAVDTGADSEHPVAPPPTIKEEEPADDEEPKPIRRGGRATLNKIMPLDDLAAAITAGELGDPDGEEDATDMPSTPPIDPADVEGGGALIPVAGPGPKFINAEFKWPRATLERLARERKEEEDRAAAFAALSPEDKGRELTAEFEARQILPAPLDEIVLRGVASPEEYSSLLLAAVAALDTAERAAAERRKAAEAEAAAQAAEADKETKQQDD